MSGKVAKKLGDGLMALFGYPVAQENDAERAVRAALSIQRALIELNRKNERHRQARARRAQRDRYGAGGGRCIGRGIRRRAEYRGAGAGAGRTPTGRRSPASISRTPRCTVEELMRKATGCGGLRRALLGLEEV
jgi:hypothetical protein